MNSVSFLTEPTLERAPKGRYRLVTPLTAWVDRQLVEVPVGFETDGASVPPLFWPIISHPLAPSSLRAAILHDYEVRTKRRDSVAVHRTFHRALLTDGCARLRAWLMWLAVRVFGPRFGGVA
jgi:hypothetical protein